MHNIDFKVTCTLDLYQQQEKDKPSQQFPNYYLGKYLGQTGNELPLKRTHRGEGEEHIPNCVLRNEDGIALIRVHNKENLTIYDLPQHAGPEVKDCVGIPKPSYPYCYVVVDYRDGKCQVAIEKTSAWDSKTTTVRNSLEKYFNSGVSAAFFYSKSDSSQKLSTAPLLGHESHKFSLVTRVCKENDLIPN